MNTRIKDMNGAATREAIRKTAFGFSLAAMAIAAMGFLGCDDEKGGEPTLIVATPANGSTVTGPNVLLKVKTTHFSFAGTAAAKSSAAQHDEADIVGGHIHVYLDKPAGLDADAVASLSKYDTITLAIPTAGPHYIIVEGANANHDDVASMVDSVKFTVTLP